MSRLRILLVAALVLAAVRVVTAQERGAAAAGVPAAYRPPAGMCRVWKIGFRPQDQPPPTDCETARSRVGLNQRVIYGDPAPAVRAGASARGEPSRAGTGGRRGGTTEREERASERGREGGERGEPANGRRPAPATDPLRCSDANRDGQCDDPHCIDRNGDGLCDANRVYPVQRPRRPA